MKAIEPKASQHRSCDIAETKDKIIVRTCGETKGDGGGLTHFFLENGSKPELTIHDHQHLRSNAGRRPLHTSHNHNASLHTRPPLCLVVRAAEYKFGLKKKKKKAMVAVWRITVDSGPR
jgi:hypothetical protein